MGNTGYGFFAEPCDACYLFLTLHVNDSGQIATVRIPLDTNELCDVDGLPVVEALLIDMPNSHWIIQYLHVLSSDIVLKNVRSSLNY